MGWTYTNRHTSIDEFFDKDWETPNNKYTCIGKGAVVNFREYYRAVRNNETDEVFCFVALIDCKGDREYNFGYKDMQDSMHPYVYNCPERILKLLTPTDNENAMAWRKICADRIAKRRKVNKIPAGSIIKFKDTYTFNSGAQGDTFVLRFELLPGDKRKTKFFSMLDNDGRPYGYYFIRNWKQQEFEVIGTIN